MKLMLIAVIVLVSVAAVAQEEKPDLLMSSRDYFKELQENDGVPAWAVNVCFSDTIDYYPPTFLLMGEDKPVLQVQYFTNGVGNHLLRLTRTKRTREESAWSALLVNDDVKGNGHHFTYTLRIVWPTGRAQTHFLGESFYLKCEAINRGGDKP